jgi:hypothetical protein
MNWSGNGTNLRQYLNTCLDEWGKSLTASVRIAGSHAKTCTKHFKIWWSVALSTANFGTIMYASKVRHVILNGGGPSRFF